MRARRIPVEGATVEIRPAGDLSGEARVTLALVEGTRRLAVALTPAQVRKVEAGLAAALRAAWEAEDQAT